MAITRTVNGVDLPASAFLSVPDPEKPSTWGLQVHGADGKPDHRLMGAAWAALAGPGFRGNKYAGPDAAACLTKLRQLYKDEGMDTPDDKAETGSIEYKTLPFEAEPLSEDDPDKGTFSGYVATFGNVDSTGDVILPGAFTKSLPTFLKDGAICWQHDWHEPIGKPLEAKEDSHGLYLKAKVSDTQRGRDALTLMRDGVVTKLSIGYKTDKARYLTDEEGLAMFGEDGYQKAMDNLSLGRGAIRALEAVTLFEGSPVTVPANSQAAILGVKHAHAGLTLEAHYAAVQDANDELLARFKSLADLRVKQGRVLSAMNQGKLQTMRDSLAGHLQMLDDMLDALLPADDAEDAAQVAKAAHDALTASLRHEMARFQRTNARLLGVPV